nr:sulfur oxidation c-type cytochrome SoxA [Hyphomicrobium methylovorum]
MIGAVSASGDPADEKLEIDGVEIITRAKAIDGLPFDEVVSGWLYREPETRKMQADAFQNPGMLAVEEGESLWGKVEGTAGKSCASCHNDAPESMKNVGAHYPKWDKKTNKPINVEGQINACRVDNMGAEPYAYNAPQQIALTAFIKHQAMGQPISLNLDDGEMKTWWEKGKDRFYLRTGQLNFNCASCHEVGFGKHIRADYLSQGQINGFPTYRFQPGSMVSAHERFRGCIRDSRANMPDGMSDELLALEVYVTSRGTGLSVETPAVRH